MLIFIGSPGSFKIFRGEIAIGNGHMGLKLMFVSRYIDLWILLQKTFHQCLLQTYQGFAQYRLNKISLYYVCCQSTRSFSVAAQRVLSQTLGWKTTAVNRHIFPSVI